MSLDRIQDRTLVSTAITTATLLASVASSSAGPCTAQIAQLEQQITQLQAGAASSGAGQPSGPQTLGAQLHHQPTQGSVENAQKQADADASAALERARKADAANDAGGCSAALDQAKQIYGFQ
jgi:hypothetical protein